MSKSPTELPELDEPPEEWIDTEEVMEKIIREGDPEIVAEGERAGSDDSDWVEEE